MTDVCVNPNKIYCTSARNKIFCYLTIIEFISDLVYYLVGNKDGDPRKEVSQRRNS